MMRIYLWHLDFCKNITGATNSSHRFASEDHATLLLRARWRSGWRPCMIACLQPTLRYIVSGSLFSQTVVLFSNSCIFFGWVTTNTNWYVLHWSCLLYDACHCERRKKSGCRSCFVNPAADWAQTTVEVGPSYGARPNDDGQTSAARIVRTVRRIGRWRSVRGRDAETLRTFGRSKEAGGGCFQSCRFQPRWNDSSP